jgi:EmrB/QacA subfamily drug resistance transporter
MDAPPTLTPDVDADPRRWLVLGVLCLSLLLIVVDNTIVNVALPSLQRDLNATTSQLQWIVDSYVLVFAGLLLTAGSLGDRFGRKGALAIGLAVMGSGSILASRVATADQLIGARALMGIGAALIMPATLSIITNVFTVPRERAKAIAIWAATSGMAVAIGPVTGGWLLEHFWWGSVFLVNVPVVVAALVLGHLFVPSSKDPAPPRLDPVGALLSIAGLVTLVWAIIEGPSGWTEPRILIAFGLAALLLAGFFAWERRIDHPMLDVRFFRNPRFSAASAAITITFFSMFGSLFLLTQYLQFVLGYTPLQTGVRFMPMAAVMMVVAPSSARLVERFGTKRVVVFGLAINALALFGASTLEVGSGYTRVLFVLMIQSVGMGLTMAPCTESIMGSLPLGRAGVGSAVNDTTRQVGGALGVAVLGSVMSSAYSSHLSDAIGAVPIPSQVRSVIVDQLGAAISIASRIGGSAGQDIAAAAKTAFVDGMSTSLLVAAGVLVVGAVLAWFTLPATAPDAHPPAATDPATSPPLREPASA